MNWLSFQSLVQISVERIFNALPAGLVLAFFAWGLLKLARRPNSQTRFAVWFFALLMVAALPLLGIAVEGWSPMPSWQGWEIARPGITVPGRWALFALLAWAFGAGIALLRLTAGMFRLLQLRRNCTPIASSTLDPLVQKTANEITASGAISIAVSQDLRIPSAVGLWKRTIVIPAWCLSELPPHDLSAILLHELAHLRRWDDWTNLLQKIVRALLFFHPAVWWIEKRLAMEREMACDDAVLAETANPHAYANCLVSLLEKSLAHRSTAGHSEKRWSMVHAAVSRAREASLRLARILDANRPAATRVYRPVLAIVAAFSVICIAALPSGPRLVAFDSGFSPRLNHAYSDSPYLASAAAPTPSSFAARLARASFETQAVQNDEPRRNREPVQSNELTQKEMSTTAGARARALATGAATNSAPRAVPARRQAEQTEERSIHALLAQAEAGQDLMAQYLIGQDLMGQDWAGQDPANQNRPPYDRTARDQRNDRSTKDYAADRVTEEEQILEASANDNQKNQPQVHTLVFFETEFVTQDVSVWRIQVWRVMVLNSAASHMVRVPVAHSI